jgi:hypothetical protein
MQAFSKFAAHLILPRYESQSEPYYWHIMYLFLADICEACRGIANWFGILPGICSLDMPGALLYIQKKT